MAFDIDDEKEVTRRLFKAIHGNTRTKFNGLMSDAINELQSLRQRNEELEQSLVAEAVNKQEFKDLQTQILSLQLTIEKMREAVSNAFGKLKSLPRFIFLSPKEGGVIRFRDPSGNWIEQHEVVKIYDKLEEELSLQPSTAELAKHDEAVRVEEREACANVAEQGHFLHENAPDALFGKACAKAIRQRKIS